MSDWQIAGITETPEGLRVDFHNDRTTQRVSGFFAKWSEPPHLGAPFTFAAHEAKRSGAAPQGET
jgi:hypothetical protein